MQKLKLSVVHVSSSSVGPGMMVPSVSELRTDSAKLRRTIPPRMQSKSLNLNGSSLTRRPANIPFSKQEIANLIKQDKLERIELQKNTPKWSKPSRGPDILKAFEEQKRKHPEQYAWFNLEKLSGRLYR
jgi:hypothetical protein